MHAETLDLATVMTARRRATACMGLRKPLCTDGGQVSLVISIWAPDHIRCHEVWGCAETDEP